MPAHTHDSHGCGACATRPPRPALCPSAQLPSTVAGGAGGAAALPASLRTTCRSRRTQSSRAPLRWVRARKGLRCAGLTDGRRCPGGLLPACSSAACRPWAAPRHPNPNFHRRRQRAALPGVQCTGIDRAAQRGGPQHRGGGWAAAGAVVQRRAGGGMTPPTHAPRRCPATWLARPPPAPQVTFHDTARMRKRIPLLSDFFGFSVGSLGEKVRLGSQSANGALGAAGGGHSAAHPSTAGAAAPLLSPRHGRRAPKPSLARCSLPRPGPPPPPPPRRGRCMRRGATARAPAPWSTARMTRGPPTQTGRSPCPVRQG